MASAAIPIPTCVADVNRDWFAQIMPGVVEAQILEVVHGTATKIHVELSYAPGHTPEKIRVWVKSGMEPHSQQDGLEVVYAGETLYYTQFADRYETRTPYCYYAGSDSAGHSILVLDDLLEQGATFVDLQKAGAPDFIARALTSIARYQAASWMAPELYAHEWLRSGGSHHAYDLPGWLYEPVRWAQYAQLPRYQKLPPNLRDPVKLERAHRFVLEDFCRRAPWALCHGDCHFGQAYVLPDGEVRLLDWQAIQIAHWAHDVSYFMAGAFSPQDRRHHERDLLHHYLRALQDFGVAQVPSEEEAWLAYRICVLHGIGWVMCPPEMQPEDNCATMAERYATAVFDHDSIGLIDSLR